MVSFFFWWQKEEDGRHMKEGVSLLRLQKCWPPFSGFLFSSLLLGVCLCTPSVCLCGLLYEESYRSGVENLDYTRLLNDQIVFQRACNLMIMQLWSNIFLHSSKKRIITRGVCFKEATPLSNGGINSSPTATRKAPPSPHRRRESFHLCPHLPAAHPRGEAR